MTSDAFTVHSFYPSETIQSVVTAILTLISLKAFEYVCKTLILASGTAKLDVGNFALGIAIDQANNPLNLISWARGNPDLPTTTDVNRRPEKRRIPLKRAVCAIVIALAIICAEIVLFYAVMPRSLPLTVGQMTLGVNQTETPSEHVLKPNTCVPQDIEIGRAELDGVFAFCNTQTGTDLDRDTFFRAVLNRTEYSLGVYFIVDGSNHTSQSVTSFSLLLPERKNARKTNMVVRLQGNTGSNASSAVTKYYKAKGCRNFGTQASLLVANCTEHVKPSEVLERILGYVTIVYDGRPGDIGTPNGEDIIVLPPSVRVGTLPGQRFTSLFMVIATPVLLTLALIVYLFIPDDGTAVVAAMVRAKTGQDASLQSIAMEDTTIVASDIYKSEE